MKTYKYLITDLIEQMHDSVGKEVTWCEVAGHIKHGDSTIFEVEAYIEGQRKDFTVLIEVKEVSDE